MLLGSRIPGYIQHCRDDASEGTRKDWSYDVLVSVLLLRRDTMAKSTLVMESIQQGACLQLERFRQLSSIVEVVGMQHAATEQ